MNDTTPSRIDHWFHGHGFSITAFKNGRACVTTDRMGEMIVFKLTQRAGYTTYHKEGSGGGLIVFEVKSDGHGLHYEGYCPLLLFGFWEKRLSFSSDAGPAFKYRAEGHAFEARFQEFLRRSSP